MRTETRGPSSRKFARRTGLIPLPTRVSKSCANETLRNGQADRLQADAIPLGRNTGCGIVEIEYTRKKERFVKKPKQGMTETSRSTVCCPLLQVGQVTCEP